MGHLSDNNQPLIMRVRRMIGQLQAVERALVGGEDCAKTLLLSAAVRGAVNGFIDELIEDHLRTHVAAPELTQKERDEGMQAVITAIRRYAK
ncbi:metal/formaldehyde-sensitive transcriptional repressor [Novosphingobium sp. P6W]|uniref:metal/formaldehyde-sensitive transcriptional repressor n=1 Tax=Novosphingobium sp. P6W TaxID=1609758 RepID=UPI0005C2A423|nr:metal/formaldehyde-sensitive transcriptional repressor [Novosphingobium sp. P6W]AXB79203.1 metal/formaldehyde-sensitive transcriptional repressor [Novosphingobium sp. P6W]KIS31904.1 transcriptional regulator [Novosphingobium sp. P6W]